MFDVIHMIKLSYEIQFRRVTLRLLLREYVKRRTRHSPPMIFAARKHYSAYTYGYIKINSGFSEPFPNADAVETTGSATGPFFGKWAKPNCSLVKRLCQKFNSRVKRCGQLRIYYGLYRHIIPCTLQSAHVTDQHSTPSKPAEDMNNYDLITTDYLGVQKYNNFTQKNKRKKLGFSEFLHETQYR